MSKDQKRSKPSGLPIIHPFAAGFDIGSRFHVVAVSPDLCDEPVQTFQAVTSDLQRMADWLITTGTKTVVMESPGMYWVAADEVLGPRGLDVILASAREKHTDYAAAHIQHMQKALTFMAIQLHHG